MQKISGPVAVVLIVIAVFAIVAMGYKYMAGPPKHSIEEMNAHLGGGSGAAQHGKK